MLIKIWPVIKAYKKANKVAHTQKKKTQERQLKKVLILYFSNKFPVSQSQQINPMKDQKL